jgi:hypothetical protein
MKIWTNKNNDMKLAIEIIKREIAQRELAQKHTHLRKDEVQLELESLNKAVEKLTIPDVSCSLPSKDEAVNVGFTKATVEGYNYRRVCREPDHDIYYSGWMDCYDWLSGNNRKQ